MLKLFKRFSKPKNLIEAINYSKLISKCTGTAIITLHLTNDDRVTRKFSYFGFICTLIWFTAYIYCTYIVYSEDQTVLRSLYNTKLQRYGDDYGRIACTIYVFYAIWKLSVNLSGDTHMPQKIVDIDRMLLNIGVKIDYTKFAYSVFKTILIQSAVNIMRTFTLWMTLTSRNIPFPGALLCQTGYCDLCSVVMTTYFSFCLIILKERYKVINNLLSDITAQKRISIHGHASVNLEKSFRIQDKHMCVKIKSCATIYSRLYKAAGNINEVFGIALSLMMLFSLLYIILNLFYFMEATASGLFHNLLSYIYFLVYVFWQIAYALGVVLLILYFCESAVNEASTTSYLAHQIINSNISPSVSAEAKRLSMQILHQKPVFSLCGMVKLDYGLLLQGALNIATFLVTLLQFVTY